MECNLPDMIALRENRKRSTYVQPKRAAGRETGGKWGGIFSGHKTTVSAYFIHDEGALRSLTLGN